MKLTPFTTHELSDNLRDRRTAEEKAEQAAIDLTTARVILANARSSQYDQIWARRIVDRSNPESRERLVWSV